MNIDQICNRYNIENYKINPDGSIDVDGKVDLSYKNLTKLPLKFNNVTGDFWCDVNNLTTLKGSPKTISGNFWCDHNRLTILKGRPKTVGGSFGCHYNQLTTLEGSPKMVGGNFWCNRNQLTSLEGAPETVGGHFWCYNNQQLTPYDMRYVLFSDISGEFCSGLSNIDNTMNIYFSLSEQEKKQKIFKILAKLKAMS